MPNICAFSGVLVHMFWRDHNPAHFHVRYGSHRALVAIDDLRIIRGELPRGVERVVIRRARTHQSELMENWRRCETNKALLKIAPPT